MNAPGDLEPGQVQPPVPLWGSADDALHGQARQRQEVRQLPGQEQAIWVHARRRTGQRVQLVGSKSTNCDRSESTTVIGQRVQLWLLNEWTKS